MSMYGKNHYNIIISFQLINGKKKKKKSILDFQTLSLPWPFPAHQKGFLKEKKKE